MSDKTPSLTTFDPYAYFEWADRIEGNTLVFKDGQRVEVPPLVATCKSCGKPAMDDRWCVAGRIHLKYGGFVLWRPCHSRWQAKNFNRLWGDCAPAGGWPRK